MSIGGSRYGAGRPAHNIKAETVPRVDVRLWSRAGRFDGPNYFSAGWTRNGEPSGNITVRSCSDSATLIYRLKESFETEWRNVEQVVPVVRTACRFGGERKWFLCPCCSRKCELLYLRSSRFACGECQHVAYMSQSGGSFDRLLLKLQRIRSPIESGRPKGMWSRTYELKWQRAEAIERLVDEHFLNRLSRIANLDNSQQ